MTLLKNNRFAAVAAVTFAALMTAILLFFCSPSTSYAASLGSEEPHIFFTYEKEGAQADGNHLNNHTYEVSIWVKGVEAISTLQVTANLDSSVTCAAEPTALMSDEIADVVSMGYVIKDGDIVFGFVSDNAEYSVINKEATLIAKLSMTFAQEGDAAEFIKVSENPNLTFIQTNYNDGYDDSYALVEAYEGYTGQLYLMTADVSPDFATPSTYSVSGSLVIMTNGNGGTDGNAVSGEYTVTVYSNEARTQVLRTIKSTEQNDGVNIKKNTFVIDGLENGTYYVTISSEYAITRDDITIIVDGADITADPIPIMACDYNGSGTISATDASLVYVVASGNQDLRFDLNGSGTVSATDASVVYVCASGGTIKPITISN